MAIFKWNQRTLRLISLIASKVYQESYKAQQDFTLAKELGQDEEAKKSDHFRRTIRVNFTKYLPELNKENHAYDTALAIAIAELHALKLLQEDIQDSQKKDEIEKEINQATSRIHESINNLIDQNKDRETSFEKLLKDKRNRIDFPLLRQLPVSPTGATGSMVGLAMGVPMLIIGSMAAGPFGMGLLLAGIGMCAVVLGALGYDVYTEYKLSRRPEKLEVKYPTYPAYERVNELLTQVEKKDAEKVKDNKEDKLAEIIRVQKPIYIQSKNERKDKKTQAASFRNVLKL